MTPEHRNHVVATLRNLVQVQDDTGANILMGRPDFWARCRLLSLDLQIAYVDGYVGGCMWNSWRTQQLHPTLELQIYQGYALSATDGRWLEHCWLTGATHLVETTGQFVLYYGAALNAEELAAFSAAAADHDPEPRADGGFWTSLGEGRSTVRIKEASERGYRFDAGRRLDPYTGERLPLF